VAPSSAAEARLPAGFAAPAAVAEIAARLESSGHEAWAVGGAVRDALFGRWGGDWDLATDARPERVRRLFRRTVPLGIEYGTVGVFGRDGVLYEVTTFRRDVETFGRRAVIAFADTLEDDLARRDFTMNAIAWRPATGELRDPLGGVEDIRAGVLRAVGVAAERFAEDYLRVLRALRFAGQYGLSIEPATWAGVTGAVAGLDTLSGERVREELRKVLGRARRASVALDLYAESGALARLYPELDALRGLDLGDAEDAWQVTLRAVDAVAPPRPLLRLAVLLHGVGWPAARTRDLRGGWRFTGHEALGARRADEVMGRLRLSNSDRERVTALVAMQSDLFPPDAPDAGIRRWLLHVPPDLVNDLFRLRIALQRARPAPDGGRDLGQRWRRAHAVLLSRPPLAVADLAIGGDDLRALGLPPGPRYGEILRALLDRVIESPELNTRESLLELARRAAS
jgi:tRNA nucleotidyltransferase (CCA-adding enzyme)